MQLLDWRSAIFLTMAMTAGDCVDAVLSKIESNKKPIEKYLYLRKLRESNPWLHYAVLYKHVTSLLPYAFILWSYV